MRVQQICEHLRLYTHEVRADVITRSDELGGQGTNFAVTVPVWNAVFRPSFAIHGLAHSTCRAGFVLFGRQRADHGALHCGMLKMGRAVCLA